MTPESRALRTRTLARIVGPYMIVMAAALFARFDTLALMLPAFMQDAPLVLATGAFTLMAGLVMLGLHHHLDTTPAIALTAIGFMAALKGAWLMIAPEVGAALTQSVAANSAILLGSALFMLLMGLWLSFVGWIADGAKVLR